MARAKRNGVAPATPVAPAVPLEAAHEATQGAQEAAAPVEPAPTPAYDYSALNAAQRENPELLQGEDLRRFAFQRGISRSEAGRMSDQKLRMQLRYLTYRQYDET